MRGANRYHETDSLTNCNRCGTFKSYNLTWVDKNKTTFQCNKCGAVKTI